MAESKLDRSPHSRHHGLLALWLVLAAGYLVASITGMRGLATAVVGLMIGALLAASGRLATGLITGTSLAALCLYFSDFMQFIIYAPPLAAFAFMAYFFHRTLDPNSEPLITRVARRENPDMPPDVEAYTRRLTLAWALCFMLLFGLALLLAPVLALDNWSRWVHGLGYVLPGTLFLGEYVYRHFRFPNRPHSSLPVLIANIVAVSKEAARPSATRNAKTIP